MHWLSWFGTLNLIEVLNYYLILGFLVSAGIRFRSYRAVLGMIVGSRNRWPKLLVLANKHRTIFLGWPTLLVVALTFALMLGNSLAIHFVWVQAKVTFAELGGHWLPVRGLPIFFCCGDDQIPRAPKGTESR
jgi:hypothetical protein